MIDELRKHIDDIDEKILTLLQDRLSVMKQLGVEKKKEAKPIRDNQREQEKLAMLRQKAVSLGLPENLVTDIWKLFFEASEEIEK